MSRLTELTVQKFMEKRFAFIELELNTFLGIDDLFYVDKAFFSDQYDIIDNIIESCELLDSNILRNYRNYNPKTKSINYFLDEFFWENMDYSKREVRKIITSIVESRVLCKKVHFNPSLKEYINEGRTRITGIRPLRPIEGVREAITANVGDKLYFSYETSIACPCYVIKNLGLHYRIIYFSNKRINSNSLKINKYDFATVEKIEVGRIPEQAIKQKRY